MGSNILSIIVSVGRSHVHRFPDGRELMLLASLIAISELVLISGCKIKMLNVAKYVVLVSLRQ